ncbi:PREDICTED: sorting nexin-29-like [Myotis brandtii]|uniref:sorting nexin-29-like n=1 Tax=Myotis brandtii TaxID=109478 RepID=UPI0007047721|nr:PREDICTED: sorting nexin-29-like [Myotis brandtii]
MRATSMWKVCCRRWSGERAPAAFLPPDAISGRCQCCSDRRLHPRLLRCRLAQDADGRVGLSELQFYLARLRRDSMEQPFGIRTNRKGPHAGLQCSKKQMVSNHLALLEGPNVLLSFSCQVYIRIKDDEWNVYRRYTEFRSLHHKLQNKYPQVRAYNFPPKKAIGNKDAKFVEERRKQLQSYLRSVMNKVIQAVPEFAASPKKETLVQLMPFFVDAAPPGEPLNKSSRPRVASRFPKLSRSHPREMRNVEPQSGDL